MKWTKEQNLRKLLSDSQVYFKGKISEETIDALTSRLINFPLQNLEEAMNKCAHNGPYYPSYSEIVAALPKFNDEKEVQRELDYKLHCAEVERERKESRKIYDNAVSKFGQEAVLDFINRYIEINFGFANCRKLNFDASLFAKSAMLELKRCNYEFGRAIGQRGAQRVG